MIEDIQMSLIDQSLYHSVRGTELSSSSSSPPCAKEIAAKLRKIRRKINTEKIKEGMTFLAMTIFSNSTRKRDIFKSLEKLSHDYGRGFDETMLNKKKKCLSITINY